jgi:transposase
MILPASPQPLKSQVTSRPETLNTQRSWLVVERLPAYAPELNPVEGLWSSLRPWSWPI